MLTVLLLDAEKYLHCQNKILPVDQISSVIYSYFVPPEKARKRLV